MSRWSNERSSHHDRAYDNDDLPPPSPPSHEPRRSRFDQGPPVQRDQGPPPLPRADEEAARARRVPGSSGERYKSRYSNDGPPSAPVEPVAFPPLQKWAETHGIPVGGRALPPDLPSKPQGLPANWVGERERERGHAHVHVGERERERDNGNGNGMTRPLLERLGESVGAGVSMVDRMGKRERERDEDEGMDGSDDLKRRKRRTGGGGRSSRHGRSSGRIPV